VVASVRLRESVPVSQVEVHVGGVDVVVWLEAERQQLPDRHAERPLTNNTIPPHTIVTVTITVFAVGNKLSLLSHWLAYLGARNAAMARTRVTKCVK